MNLFLYLFITSFFSIIGDENKTSFYPIEVGSYWTWQDTVLRKRSDWEIAEVIDPNNCFQKDSVVSVTGLNGVKEYTIKRKKIAASVEGYSFVIKIDTTGRVFYKKHLIALSAPHSGDTIYDFIGTRYIIQESKNDSSVIIASTKTNRCFYKQGVGLIGEISSNLTGRNLIEYRIGNGPVVKKHWLMEAPEKK